MHQIFDRLIGSGGITEYFFGISFWKNPSRISTFFWMSCDSRVHSSMCQSSPWVTSLVVGFQFPVLKFFPFPRLSQRTSWIDILRVFSGSSDAVAPANNLYIAVYWESKSSRRFLKKWKFIGSLMKPVMKVTFCSCSCFFFGSAAVKRFCRRLQPLTHPQQKKSGSCISFLSVILGYSEPCKLLFTSPP